MGRKSISLSDVRSDGWFSQIGETSPTFAQLCDVLGDRTVAFSIIAGLRITSVAVNTLDRDQTTVCFTLDDSRAEQELPLGELRLRLCATMLGADPVAPELSDEPDVEELQRFVGMRYVLIAPLFDIGLRELIVDEGPVGIVVEFGGSVEEVPLAQLREAIRARVRQVAMGTQQPFSLDFAILDEVLDAAEKEEHGKIIELIGSWPGPLSMLLRSAEGQELDLVTRGRIARALGALGSALHANGAADQGDEVMRLAIQWGQDSDVAGEVFMRLGATYAANERFGEAIGLLRRSIALGGSRVAILPSLAECYFERGRFVAAAASAQEAIDLGREDAEEVLDRAVAKLGVEKWTRFREAVARSAP